MCWSAWVPLARLAHWPPVDPSASKVAAVVISLIGVYGPPYAGVDIGTFMNKAQTMRTGQASVKRYMPQLFEHIREGRIRPSDVLTHRGPLEDAPKLYRTMARKHDGCIKVALFPNGTNIH